MRCTLRHRRICELYVTWAIRTEFWNDANVAEFAGIPKCMKLWMWLLVEARDSGESVLFSMSNFKHSKKIVLIVVYGLLQVTVQSSNWSYHIPAFRVLCQRLLYFFLLKSLNFFSGQLVQSRWTLPFARNATGDYWVQSEKRWGGNIHQHYGILQQVQLLDWWKWSGAEVFVQVVSYWKTIWIHQLVCQRAKQRQQ